MPKRLLTYSAHEGAEQWLVGVIKKILVLWYHFSWLSKIRVRYEDYVDSSETMFGYMFSKNLSSCSTKWKKKKKKRIIKNRL